MPHVPGHNPGGLMTNPYQQAAESMQQAGLSGVGDVGVKERKKTSEKNPSYVPPQSGGTITETQPSGPVGSSGKGKWNAGFDDDEESKSWDSVQNNPNRNRILNEVVAKYNQPWLGAHNKWGNFEDDLPITQAVKWGSNFIFRTMGITYEIPKAKFFDDPVMNTYEALQDAGYIAPAGTPRTTPIYNIETTIDDPYKFAKKTSTGFDIGTAAWGVKSIPTMFNALKNIYKNWTGTTAVAKSKNAKIQPLIINADDIDANALPKIEGKTAFLITNKDGQSFWKYYDNVDSPLEQSGVVPLFTGTDEAAIGVKSHLDKAHQINRSYVDGLPKIMKWNDLPYADGGQTILTNLVHKTYTAKNSKLKQILDDAGVTPQNNPEAFQTVIINGEEQTIPKIVYHATSSFFDKGLKSNAKAIHSADDKMFLGVTDNIDDSLGYAKMEEALLDPKIPQQFQVEPRIYISIPKINNTFNVNSNPFHLDEAATYIGTQRYNHIQGNKRIDWDDAFDYEDQLWYGADRNSSMGQWTVDEHIEAVKLQLSDMKKSNWKPLENEMRLFDDVIGQPTSVILKDGTIANHKLQLNGYDSFVTKESLFSKFDEAGQGYLHGGPSHNQTNIMIFDADKNLIPATQYIDEIPKIKQSPFSGMVYGTEDQPFQSIGQAMFGLNLQGKDALGFPLGSDTKVLYELLGDAGDTINQPTTPFDNDIEADNFAKFV